MKKIYIYGASGHGKVVWELAKLSGYKIEGFIDDNPQGEFFGMEAISFEEFLQKEQNYSVIPAIGDNGAREKVYNRLKSHSFTIPTLIHPSAAISSFANIQEGAVVMAGAIINPDAKIGRCAIINTGAVVDHDCEVSDFCHIAPNSSLAGGVCVGKSSFIGIGSTIIQNISITSNVVVGAGSVVVKDLSTQKVYKGNPAK